jgi:hypothetical protein
MLFAGGITQQVGWLASIQGTSSSSRSISSTPWTAAPRSTPAAAATPAPAAGVQTSITITTPDDWHLHVRDGDSMRSVVPLTAAHFARAIIMPNLVPPVTNVELVSSFIGKLQCWALAAAEHIAVDCDLALQQADVQVSAAVCVADQQVHWLCGPGCTGGKGHPATNSTG